MLRYRFADLAACVVLSVCATAADAADADDATPGRLSAGAATSNITPPLGELIVGGFKPFPATHIHDELHARCLVLDDGATRLAIVLCDNVGIPREVYDAARKLIPESAGLPPENLLAAATHTHSATSARTANRLVPTAELSPYSQFVAERIAAAVVNAVRNLEPAEIGWGRVNVPEEVFNRRWFMVPGDGKHLRNPFGGVDQVRMNPPRGDSLLLRPAGPVDPQVCFLSVRSADGRPIALLANYSLHYVGGVGPGAISADYFAIFADRIQQKLDADRLDPPFVGMLSNGTSGDVNNINFREKTPSRKPYEKMREVADRLADAVYEAHSEIEFHDRVPLASRRTELTLAVRKPTAEMVERVKKIIETPDDAPGWHGLEANYAQRVLTQAESPDSVTIPLQTLQIGEVGIAAIPFEVFTAIGLTIKKESPFPLTFTIELANGSYAYLPTPEQHALGGYETWLGTNLVEVEASPKIEQAIDGLFDELPGGSTADATR
ncbi:MAG: neutral/alkaline non-lysosomal ceramidase N-terminal domain-containing protein [Planctomycetaceae bacterium]